MTKEKIKTLVFEYLEEEQYHDLNEIKETTILCEDLFFDSLDFLELIIKLENQFNLVIVDKDFKDNVKTVGDIVDFIYEKVCDKLEKAKENASYVPYFNNNGVCLNDLTIGSHVMYKGLKVRVSEIYEPAPRVIEELSDIYVIGVFDGTSTKLVPFYMIEGIMITDEIVEKNGFIRRKSIDLDYLDIIESGGILFRYNHKKNIFEFGCYKDDDKKILPLHLHILENMFYTSFREKLVH